MSETLFRYVGTVLDALAQSGVRDVVLCPGSRSTPLALVAHRHRGLRTWMHLDERSAGFFALGLAKASGQPAAVIVTSGTAVANLFPAVVEARYGRVPLLLLTADRPPEAQEVGSLQTIDQLHVFGRHVKWFQQMLLADEDPDVLRHAVVTAARAVSEAVRAPAGPVHLNFPFREPLIPGPPQRRPDGLAAELPRFSGGARGVARAELEAFAVRLRRAARGLVVAGPIDDPDFPAAVAGLATALRWPLIADALSGTRDEALDAPTRLVRYDLWIRDPEVQAQLQPEFVLRFGAVPVSKPLWQFLGKLRGATQLLISPGGAWGDPTLATTELLDADPVPFCRDVTAALAGLPEGAADERWLAGLRALDAAAGAAVDAALAETPVPNEPEAVREAVAAVPPGGACVVGNSMPVRDVDTFVHAMPAGVRLLANRGASGIDGVVSTICGVAAKLPTVGVLGDLSFFHDSNGLLAVRRFGLAPVFVVIDNDGGGIFSFLPQAEHGEAFEELFGTPHGLQLGRFAEIYGLAYVKAEARGSVREAVARAIRSETPTMVHVQTDRRQNLDLHRRLAAEASRAVRELLGSGIA